MSWSYDPELTEDKDRVRLLIGDTISTQQQFQDEELVWILSENGSSIYAAAASACRMLAAKYSRQADKWVGDLKILASQKARSYLALAESFDAKAGSQMWAIPSAGGVYVDEKEAAAADTSLVQPEFTRGMMTNTES